MPRIGLLCYHLHSSCSGLNQHHLLAWIITLVSNPLPWFCLSSRLHSPTKVNILYYNQSDSKWTWERSCLSWHNVSHLYRVKPKKLEDSTWSMNLGSVIPKLYMDSLCCTSGYCSSLTVLCAPSLNMSNVLPPPGLCTCWSVCQEHSSFRFPYSCSLNSFSVCSNVILTDRSSLTHYTK